MVCNPVHLGSVRVSGNSSEKRKLSISVRSYRLLKNLEIEGHPIHAAERAGSTRDTEVEQSPPRAGIGMLG